MLHALTAEFPLLMAWIDPPKAPLRPQLELSELHEEGRRVFEIRADIADLGPEELVVRVGPDAIEVEGAHRSAAAGCGRPAGELRFARHFHTPGVAVERVTASFVDGVLVIRAPVDVEVANAGWAHVDVHVAA